MREEWTNFKEGSWCDEINVRDFIQNNYTLYEGDESFLSGATEATKKLSQMVFDLNQKEREAGGVLDADTSVVSTLTSHGAGYLDKDLEKIVGVQTDKPFKRSLQPFGGIRMSESALRRLPRRRPRRPGRNFRTSCLYLQQERKGNRRKRTTT